MYIQPLTLQQELAVFYAQTGSEESELSVIAVFVSKLLFLTLIRIHQSLIRKDDVRGTGKIHFLSKRSMDWANDVVHEKGSLDSSSVCLI